MWASAGRKAVCGFSSSTLTVLSSTARHGLDHAELARPVGGDLAARLLLLLVGLGGGDAGRIHLDAGDAFERTDHVGGRDRTAVGPLRVLAQRQQVGRRRSLLPALGQAGAQLHVLVGRQQRLVDHLVHLPRVDGAGDVHVHAVDVAANAPAEGLLRLRGACSETERCCHQPGDSARTENPSKAVQPACGHSLAPRARRSIRAQADALRRTILLVGSQGVNRCTLL